MAEFGISIDGRAPIADIAAQARAAEDGGAHTFWIACHLFLRDPITTAVLALGATRRIKVALMAMSPYSVHPVFTAMAVVILCLGVGAPADLQAAGIASPKPLATLREAIALCRALFAGETITAEGAIFRTGGRRLVNGGRTIPIVLAASRPNMLGLAGQVADGVLISAGTAPAFVRACLDSAESRAGGRVFRKLCIVYTRLGANERQAMDSMRRPLSYVLRGAHHADNIRLSGAPLDQPALAAAYAAEDWPAVERLVGDEVVRRHTACGTPAQVKAKFDEYHAIGLDEVIIGGIEEASGITAALAATRGAT